MADDFIKRSEVLIAINEFYHDPKVDIAIRNIPAADVVEVVHSKWIKRNNERRCPVCGFFYLTNGMRVYNFCPMCGAKMDGERRSDE